MTVFDSLRVFFEGNDTIGKILRYLLSVTVIASAKHELIARRSTS